MAQQLLRTFTSVSLTVSYSILLQFSTYYMKTKQQHQV